MLNEDFVILGAFASVCGAFSYVVDTIRGKTRPNRISWFLWAVAPLVAFAAEIDEGVGLRSLMTFMVGFGPLMIFLASFVNRKSYWKVTRLDYACGAIALAALVLWALTRTGNVAIVFSILSDGLAAVPTLIKAYKEPESESIAVFLLSAVNASITLLTIKTWTFANYGFPVYIFSICMLVVLVVKVVHRRSTPTLASITESASY